MTRKFSRRGFLKTTGAATGATAVGVGLGQGLSARPAEAALPLTNALSALGRKADLPSPGGPRVVVVGGGWSGLILAKQLVQEKPGFDVVLIEKRASFFSCPLSNLWLVEKLSLDFISHSYLDAARNNGYIYLNGAVVDVDRQARTVFTDQGSVAYDYLVLAPGIDYDYTSVGIEDPAEALRIATHYPAAFKPGSEHLTLRRKLENFEGGTFVLTVPDGNYRCPPAPFERACMIAGYFKENDIDGKVLILDKNPSLPFHPDGIRKAFKDLYGGVIEHVQGVEISGVDPAARQIETSNGVVKFDDACIYPRIRGARLIETLGLIKAASTQKEADIDPINYHIPGDDRVFVAGDARPMPFVKSGFAANFEAKHLSALIARRLDGDDLEPLHEAGIMCYVAVNAWPLQSIAFKISFGWVYDPKTKGPVFRQKAQAFTNRSRSFGKANVQWGRALYQEMFY